MTLLVGFIHLYIHAALHVSYGAKINSPQEPATKLDEDVDISQPLLFLQAHRNQKGRGGYSADTAFTSASRISQKTAPPNEIQQDSAASLTKVKSLLRDLAAKNQELAEEATTTDDNELLEVQQGAGASSPSVDTSMADANELERKTRQDVPASAALNQVSDDFFPTNDAESSLINPDPQQRVQPRATDPETKHFSEMRSFREKPFSFLSFDRPQASSGTADIVHFGLYGKVFYGTDLKRQEFTIDVVMTLKWVDERTMSLVSSVAGAPEHIVMSAEEASSKIWQPKVEIANKVVPDSEHISSSTSIAKNGTITLIERSLVVIKNKFQLEDYPFDEQTLRLSISSEKYRLSELVLSPMEDSEVSGLRDGFFDNEAYEMVDVSVNAHDDVDAALQKSSGDMDIVVRRRASKYQHSYLFPVVLYSAIACAVFWLPFTPSFVVARLALSVLILLVFSSFAMTTNAELPEDAPYNWIDLICFLVELHMFAVICLNIYTEVAYHTMGCKRTASHMNNELKLLSPLTIGMAFALVYVGSSIKGPLNLTVLTVLLPIIYALFMITYMTCSAFTLAADVRTHKPTEKEEWDGNYGSDVPFTSESLSPAPRPY